MTKTTFNFILIHGWAFDKFFWSKLKEMLEKKNFCSEVFCVDLNYFSSFTEIKRDLDIVKNKVFIVHSYGLQWFLKKNFDCKLLINFFGSPNFLKFQNNPKLKKKIEEKMIQKFMLCPNLVLKNFYEQCGLEFKKTNINKKRLLDDLIELTNNDLEKEFKQSSFEKISFFNFEDNIFSPSNKIFKNLESEKHRIFFLNKNDHCLPQTQPKLALKLIEKSLKL